MNNTTSLNRSIPYWVLSALSLVAVAAGGWLVWANTSTMQSTLLDGTATNVEVYVGQAWITAGAGILAAGIIGVLLALALGAATTLRAAAPPVVVEAIDWTDDDAPAGAPGASTGSAADTSSSATDGSGSVTDATDPDSDLENDLDDQNGSSGSTATATKISVK